MKALTKQLNTRKLTGRLTLWLNQWLLFSWHWVRPSILYNLKDKVPTHAKRNARAKLKNCLFKANGSCAPWRTCILCNFRSEVPINSFPFINIPKKSFLRQFKKMMVLMMVFYDSLNEKPAWINDLVLIRGYPSRTKSRRILNFLLHSLLQNSYTLTRGIPGHRITVACCPSNSRGQNGDYFSYTA